MEQSHILRLKITDLVSSLFQGKLYDLTDELSPEEEASIDELKESIDNNGLLQPIVVRPSSKEEGHEKQTPRVNMNLKNRVADIKVDMSGLSSKKKSRIKKSDYHTVLLIEGNPYNTSHDISRQAIRGALLSVSVSWQIPIIFSSNPSDSVDMLIMAGKQLLQNNCRYLRKGHKPKRIKSKLLYFLQGLPSVGPSISNALLEHFGSPENEVLASEDELMEIEGLGGTKARRIRKFLSQRFKFT